MSLRGRILALTVGVAAAVLVLFAVPLVLLLHQAATEEARQNATDVAQGVADYVSAGHRRAATPCATTSTGSTTATTPTRSRWLWPTGPAWAPRCPASTRAIPTATAPAVARAATATGTTTHRYGDLRPTSQAESARSTAASWSSSRCRRPTVR